jgi:hypothetical protein
VANNDEEISKNSGREFDGVSLIDSEWHRIRVPAAARSAGNVSNGARDRSSTSLRWVEDQHQYLPGAAMSAADIAATNW